MGRFKKYRNEIERQAARKQRERERRATETNEEREERLRKLSINAQKRRAEESTEERKQRLRRLSQNELKRRAKETNEERDERLKKLSQYAKNRRAAGPNNHNTQLGKKMDRGQNQNANGYIKVNLLKYYDVHEDHHQEQMQHNPGNKLSHLKRTSKWKRNVSKTLQIEEIIPGTNSRQKNSRLSQTRSRLTSHALSDEISVVPQSTIPEVHEKHILVVPNHQTAVMSNLFSLWKTRRLCDSYISNGTTNVMVHKMVLGAVCPKLLPALHYSSKGSFPKVVFPSSVSREGLLAFIEYMYTGVLDLNEDILVQLKTIGEKLEMKDFEELCSKELKKAKAKNILSTVVEPLLAEPCSLSGLFPSKNQVDTNEIQNSTLMKLLRNICNNTSIQTDVAINVASTSRSSPSCASDVRSAENMATSQILDIKTEMEPETEPAPNQNSLELNSPEEEMCMGINNVQLKPAATDGNINKDNGLTVTYSNNQYKNDINMDSSDMNVSDINQSEETCLSQHTENCDKETDNQKELQLISVTSATGNISEDSFGNNSDVMEISSTMCTNTDPPQTSNPQPFPVSLFSVNDDEDATLLI